MNLQQAEDTLKKNQEWFPKQDFKIDLDSDGEYRVRQFANLEKQKARHKPGKLNCFRDSNGKIFLYEYKGRRIEKLGGFIMCVHWNVEENGRFIFHAETRKEAIEIIDRIADGVLLKDAVNYQFQLEHAYT